MKLSGSPISSYAWLKSSGVPLCMQNQVPSARKFSKFSEGTEDQGTFAMRMLLLILEKRYSSFEFTDNRTLFHSLIQSLINSNWTSRMNIFSIFLQASFSVEGQFLGIQSIWGCKSWSIKSSFFNQKAYLSSLWVLVLLPHLVKILPLFDKLPSTKLFLLFKLFVKGLRSFVLLLCECTLLFLIWGSRTCESSDSVGIFSLSLHLFNNY
jgi:hypothetical protein